MKVKNYTNFMVIISFYHTDKGKSIKKRLMKKTLNFKEKRTI